MFKNLSNLTQVAGLFKNLGQMKGRIAEAKKHLAGRKVVGETDGSRVHIEMNGLGEVTNVQVHLDLLTPEMQSQLQKLLQEAINKAVGRARELHMESIREITKGVDLPGLDGVLQEIGS